MQSDRHNWPNRANGDRGTWTMMGPPGILYAPYSPHRQQREEMRHRAKTEGATGNSINPWEEAVREAPGPPLRPQLHLPASLCDP